jgi:tetratricopeptide (TPR) repeat protein
MRLAAVLLALALFGLPLPNLVWAQDATSTSQKRTDELDQLFGKLQNPKDSEAISTEQRIWQLWMQSDNAAHEVTLAQATDAMGTGNYKSSEELLNQLVAAEAGFAEAWNKRATLYFLMGRLDDSLADIVKTLELEPRHFGALSGRGMILVRQGKYREALVAYREAQSMNPHMPGVNATIKQLETLLPDL